MAATNCVKESLLSNNDSNEDTFIKNSHLIAAINCITSAKKCNSKSVNESVSLIPDFKQFVSIN